MTQQAEKVKKGHPIANKVGGVFMHVSNMERSANWYHQLFGMPERSSVTSKVHSLKMSAGSNFVLDQHGYDRGLAMNDRPILMFDSPDVHAAYRYVKQLGIPIEWEIEQYPGMAFFTFRDPDGNLLMVCGKPGSAADTGEAASQKALLRYDGGGATLEVSESSYASEITGEGLVLTGRAHTELTYATPLKIETTVRIDSGNLRLLYGRGQLTFNYGSSDNGGTGEEFYVGHPKVNKQFGYLKKGGIAVGEWVRVEWTLHERSIEVRVNGAVYHMQEGYFGDLEAKAGIGCDNGRITVRTFSVQSIAGEEAKPRLPIETGGGASRDWLVADSSCCPLITHEGLWLSCDEQWGSARTTAEYEAPFALTAELRSDTGTAVLYGGVSARVKFHSEGSLSFLDPVTKEEIWAEGSGRWSGDAATVTWTVEHDRTTVSVDGELRFERKGDYSGRRFRLAIGADLGGAVTVKSVQIK